MPIYRRPIANCCKKIYEEDMKHSTYHGETMQDSIMKHIQSFYPTLTLAGISIHVQSCYPTLAPAGINIHLFIYDKQKNPLEMQ